jgi:hypothetical protein
LRREKTFWVRLASVTKTPGQTRSIRSDFSTTAPARSIRTRRMENALGVIDTGSPSRRRRRRTGSTRKASNSYSTLSFSSRRGIIDNRLLRIG